MESEKPHRSGVRRSDFFLCFSSRSSMKISSKSILSPGRSREPTLSLSSSLSRRLRSNGSMKGGQSSPMFPTGSKKKGCSFETAEPSSPKVTCIGQVRVKTKKKHGRKMRTRSKRRGAGEVSFRKTEEGGVIQQQESLKHRNQRWVHLPLTICEALRGFGAEFNCFSPCGGRRSSSCSWSGERGKGEKMRKRRRSSGSNSGFCGAVFAKWLFALEENEENKERVVVVSREEEKIQKRDEREGFHPVEIEEEMEEFKEEVVQVEVEVEEEEEEGRVSICIPPKNALLLMRSRSEPFRTSSLANRFWDDPAPKENVEDDDDDDDDGDEQEEEQSDEVVDEEIAKVEEVVEEDEVKEEKFEQVEEYKAEEVLAEVSRKSVSVQEGETPLKQETPETADEDQNPEREQEEEEEPHRVKEEEIMVNGSSSSPPEALPEEEEEETKIQEQEEVEEERVSFTSSSVSASASTLSVQEPEEEEETEEVLAEEEEDAAAAAAEPAEPAVVEKSTVETEEGESKSEVKQTDGQDGELLPDCLLLMMCEPKLSMEVSKETWVCSTDFIRYRNEHPEKTKVIQTNGQDQTKKRLTTDSNPKPHAHPAQHKKHHPPRPKQQKQQQKVQPPRSSCSAAVGPSMASMIEKKLTSAGAYEPFVLTRCKSEPVRSTSKLATAAAAAAPEACFWNNRKIEPHRAAAAAVVGVRAAGVGF